MEEKLNQILASNAKIPLLSERATVCLRDAIVQGVIQAETKLTEEMVASLFHISRTPAREALGKMVEEGYVIHVPRVGLVVRKWTVEDFTKIYAVTHVLHSHAVHTLCQMNPNPLSFAYLYEILDQAEAELNTGNKTKLAEVAYEINVQIPQLTGNEWLVQAILPLRMKLRLLKPHLISDSSSLEDCQNIIAMYRQQLDAIINGDADLAEQIVEKEFSNATLLKQKYGHTITHFPNT